MIKSCNECQNICCKTGPGPYMRVSPKEYLENFGYTEAYNTKCIWLRRNKCMVWGTKDHPFECKVYICQSRRYSKKELARIKELVG